LIFRIVLERVRGLGTLGLLTSRVFLLEIECNKTMIHTITVRESSEDPGSWLENSVRDSVNHSFVAQIFRIVLEGARGLGPLDFLLLGFSF
jgi:hypothetical protein